MVIRMDFLKPIKGKKVTGYILRASFTTKDGVTYYAKNYGKRAFRIPIYAA